MRVSQSNRKFVSKLDIPICYSSCTSEAHVNYKTSSTKLTKNYVGELRKSFYVSYVLQLYTIQCCEKYDTPEVRKELATDFRAINTFIVKLIDEENGVTFKQNNQS